MSGSRGRADGAQRRPGVVHARARHRADGASVPARPALSNVANTASGRLPGMHITAKSFVLAGPVLVALVVAAPVSAQDRLAPGALPPAERPFGTLRDQAGREQPGCEER